MTLQNLIAFDVVVQSVSANGFLGFDVLIQVLVLFCIRLCCFCFKSKGLNEYTYMVYKGRKKREGRKTKEIKRRHRRG